MKKFLTKSNLLRIVGGALALASFLVEYESQKLDIEEQVEERVNSLVDNRMCEVINAALNDAEE